MSADQGGLIPSCELSRALNTLKRFLPRMTSLMSRQVFQAIECPLTSRTDMNPFPIVLLFPERIGDGSRMKQRSLGDFDHCDHFWGLFSDDSLGHLEVLIFGIER